MCSPSANPEQGRIASVTCTFWPALVRNKIIERDSGGQLSETFSIDNTYFFSFLLVTNERTHHNTKTHTGSESSPFVMDIYM